VAHEAMTTGRRYGGEAAAVAGIVEQAVAAELVLATAKELAATIADKDPKTLGTIKRRLYAGTLAALREPSSL